MSGIHLKRLILLLRNYNYNIHASINGRGQAGDIAVENLRFRAKENAGDGCLESDDG